MAGRDAADWSPEWSLDEVLRLKEVLATKNYSDPEVGNLTRAEAIYVLGGIWDPEAHDLDEDLRLLQEDLDRDAARITEIQSWLK